MRKHTSPLICTTALVLLLAACTPKQVPQPAASATTDASAATAAPPEQTCTNEPRTDDNDNRPRCGGMGTPPAPSHAYRITLDNGESFTACDITQPFSGKIGRGMVTMSFKPSDHRNGTVAWHFVGGGGMADTAYDYALSGPEEKMTGAFRANSAVCGKAAGLGACAAAKKQTFSSTWTRIERCEAAQ